MFCFLLRQEEEKLLQFGTLKSNDHAFIAKSKNTYNFFGKQGHVESKCFKKYSKDSCNFCGREGHVDAKCFEKSTCKVCGKKVTLKPNTFKS